MLALLLAVDRRRPPVCSKGVLKRIKLLMGTETWTFFGCLGLVVHLEFLVSVVRPSFRSLHQAGKLT